MALLTLPATKHKLALGRLDEPITEARLYLWSPNLPVGSLDFNISTCSHLPQDIENIVVPSGGFIFNGAKKFLTRDTAPAHHPEQASGQLVPKLFPHRMFILLPERKEAVVVVQFAHVVTELVQASRSVMIETVLLIPVYSEHLVAGSSRASAVTGTAIVPLVSPAAKVSVPAVAA